MDGGSSPPISTVYTGSRQTSAPALAVFALQIHGLRGTSDDVFLRKFSHWLGFFCGDKFTPSVTHVTPPRWGDTRLPLALYASHTPTRRSRLMTAWYRGDRFTPSQHTLTAPDGGISDHSFHSGRVPSLLQSAMQISLTRVARC